MKLRLQFLMLHAKNNKFTNWWINNEVTEINFHGGVWRMNLGVSLPKGRGGSAPQQVLLYLFSGDSRQNQSVVTVGGVVFYDFCKPSLFCFHTHHHYNVELHFTIQKITRELLISGTFSSQHNSEPQSCCAGAVRGAEKRKAWYFSPVIYQRDFFLKRLTSLTIII